MDNRDDLREELAVQRTHKANMDYIKYAQWLADVNPTTEEIIAAIDLCIKERYTVCPLNVRQFIPEIRSRKLADDDEYKKRMAEGIEEFRRLCIIGEHPELAELVATTPYTSSLLDIAGKI